VKRSIANLKRYLDMVPELSSRMLLSYRHLTEGITNESYHLKFSKDEYVMKFFNHEAIDLGVDHKKELLIMSRVESLNIATTVIYIDLKEEFSIYRWIDGTFIQESFFDGSTNLKRLIQRIKQVHETEAEGLPEQDLIVRAKDYREKLLGQTACPELTSEDLLEQAERLVKESASVIPDCLCHNDLLATNILATDDLHFLDWEFAGINSPMFELAVLCRGNNLNETQQDKVLAYYFDDDSKQHKVLLQKWMWLYDYIRLLWEEAVQKEASEYTTEQRSLLDAIISNKF